MRSLTTLSLASALMAGLALSAACSADAVAARPSGLAGSDVAAVDEDEDVDDALDAGRRDASKKKDATGDVAQEEEEEEPSDASAVADATPVATDAKAPEAGPAGPTFSDVYAKVIGVSCVGCHGPTHVTGLDMKTKSAAYSHLVGVKAGTGGAGSCNDGLRTRVVPGDANASLLYRKLAHTNDCGSGMPLGGAKLSKTKLTLVQGWINAGALNN